MLAVTVNLVLSGRRGRREPVVLFAVDGPGYASV
jgi:hypothetical protein